MTTTTPTPPVSSPPFSSPPDFRLDDSFCAWSIAPWGFVSWFPLPRARFTVEAARYMGGHVRDAILPRRPPGGRLTVVHSWENVVGYDSAARQAMVDIGRTMKDELGDSYIVLGEGVPPLVRMGVDVASVALRPFGVRLTLGRSFAEVAARIPGLRHSP